MKPNRLFHAVLFLFGWVSGAVAAGPEDSVVCVFASLRLPNPTRPCALRTFGLSASGVLLPATGIA